MVVSKPNPPKPETSDVLVDYVLILASHNAPQCLEQLPSLMQGRGEVLLIN